MSGAGLQWDLPEGVELDDCLMLWLGAGDAPALTQLMLTYSRRFPPPSLILEQSSSTSSIAAAPLVSCAMALLPALIWLNGKTQAISW